MSLSTLSFEAWAIVLHFTDYWHHARLASTGDKQVLRALTHVERELNLTDGPLDVYHPTYSTLVTALLAGNARSMTCTGRQLYQFVGPFPALERLTLTSPVIVVLADPLDREAADAGTIDIAAVAPNLKRFRLEAHIKSHLLKLPATLQSLEISYELTQVACMSLMAQLQHFPNLTLLKFASTSRRRMFAKGVVFPPRLTSLHLTICLGEEWLIASLPSSLTSLHVHAGLVICTSDLSHLTSLVDLTVTNDFSTKARGCCLHSVPPSITRLYLGTVSAGSEEEMLANFRTLPPSLTSLSFTSVHPPPSSGDALVDMINVLAPRVTPEDAKRILIAVSHLDVASSDDDKRVTTAIEGALVRHGEDAAHCAYVLRMETRMRSVVTFSTRRTVYNSLVARGVPQSAIVSLFDRNPWKDACWGSVLDEFLLDETSKARFIAVAELTRISKLCFTQTGCVLPPSVASNLTHIDMLIDKSSVELSKVLSTKLERLQQLSITFDLSRSVQTNPSACWKEAVNTICEWYANLPQLHTILFTWSSRSSYALDAESQEALAQIRFYPIRGGMQFKFRVEKPRVPLIIEAK
jgi:hypothetical protein